jgi:two-component system, chemotaxis family, sensor kinase CheA
MTEDTNLAVDEMKEIIDDFLIEADELINSLDTNLVTLESKPDDLELLNGIFRAAHTIKGTSSFLGFEQVTSLTHKMEDILNRLRKAELKVTPEIMDVLLESVDILKILMENVRSGNTEYVDLESILSRLVTANEGTSPATTETKTADSTGSTTASPTAEDGPGVTTLTEDKGAVEEESDDQQATTRKAVTTVPGKSVDSQTIRVDVERLDSLMNLSGELVLSRNGLLQTINMMNKSGEANALTEQFNRAAANLNYITTELQLAVMKMRMQPIGKVFSKFPRLVRDLSREMHKNIELTIQGETTELDKSVIEEIGDPLVHIVRNSCDHGIETPEERVAKGKPATGHVIMSASQEGSNIVIKVSDDGKGLDVTAIRAKAVERGMISEFDAGRLSDREAFKFIFAAGLSTAKVVTDVSGRGVGMDVVRTNIEKLNGLIELDSAVDVGTTITIKLPLTLAIIQGLLIESDDEVYILPLSSVHETVRSEHTAVYYINRRPVMRLRDEIIPLINLGKVLRENAAGFTLTEKPYVVVVGLADRKLGIMIDRFLGQEEVVIKSLGRYLGATDGVAGATILGDGRIRLIVDLIGLFSVATRLH